VGRVDDHLDQVEVDQKVLPVARDRLDPDLAELLHQEGLGLALGHRRGWDQVVEGWRQVSWRSTYLARRSVSMFTRSPTWREPRVVTSRVWGMRATLKRSGSTSTRVRLTPSTATEPLVAI